METEYTIVGGLAFFLAKNKLVFDDGTNLYGLELDADRTLSIEEISEFIQALEKGKIAKSDWMEEHHQELMELFPKYQVQSGWWSEIKDAFKHGRTREEQLTYERAVDFIQEGIHKYGALETALKTSDAVQEYLNKLIARRQAAIKSGDPQKLKELDEELKGLNDLFKVSPDALKAIEKEAKGLLSEIKIRFGDFPGLEDVPVETSEDDLKEDVINILKKKKINPESVSLTRTNNEEVKISKRNRIITLEFDAQNYLAFRKAFPKVKIL